MAKLTGALLSFGARGTLGDTVTFASWRGVPYARQKVNPGNPNTTAQQETRNIFSSLSAFWRAAPGALWTPWDDFAQGRKFTGRNAFIGQNQRILRDIPPKTSMAGFIASPGSKGGIPPQGMALTPGADNIAVALTIPDSPTGWTLEASHAICFVDQAPSTLFSETITYATDDATPEDLTLSGLESAEDYIVAAWLEWTKPNGDTAYSISVPGTATTS